MCPVESPNDALLDAARRRVILAVDVPTLDAARALVEKVAPHVGALKIGKELFTSRGPDTLCALHPSALPVFLDLKYHDIPNTVAGAVRSAARLGVRWISLHTAGGAAMLQAAAQARDEMPEPRPRLLGVTALTSDGEADEEEVVDRALLAQSCGLDGAIASPREVARLRAACGPGFLLVTPGVRPEGVAAGDQRRTATPGAAIRDGADLLVVGRPITAAADPAAAAAALVREVAAALSEPAGQPAGLPDGSIPSRLQFLLRRSEALLEGHFKLSSGLHSDRYVQCAKLLQHPRLARRSGTWLAERLRRYQPQAVVSVALGGLVIGQEVAAALGIRALFAERDESGTLKLRRGFALDAGERVVVVDDVCTRGGSIAECSQLVRHLGAEVVVAGALIDRSGGNHTLDVPLEALLEVEAKAVPPDDCMQCAAGVAIDKPGSRKQA